MHNTVSELETGNELYQNEVGRPSTRYFFRVFPTQCSFRSKIYLEPRYLEDRHNSLRLKNFVFVSSVAVMVEKDSKQKHNLSEDKNGNQNHIVVYRMQFASSS